MDSSERKRRSREKLRSDPEKWRIYLEKEKARDKKRREKKKQILRNNKKKLHEERTAVKLRVRKSRERMKNTAVENQMSPLGSYKCRSTLRKAVNKAKKYLPSSPSKQQAVILELAKERLAKNVIKDKEIITQPKRSDSLSEEVINKVKMFYERDDISRPTPNRKDVMRIKDSTGGKSTIAKRHLVMTVSEVFALFKMEYPDIEIHRSKFFQLRPIYVRVVSEMPHNVCVCLHHGNFGYLIDSFKSIQPEIQTPSQFLQEICCDVNKEVCMTNECTSCFYVWDIVNIKDDLSAHIIWKQWAKSTDGWLQLQEITDTKEKLIREIEQTNKFKVHCFVKQQQSKFFEESKARILDTEAIMQIDFAENYSIISQDEIQSAHWRHPQATLFTCCVWVDIKVVLCYLIISNAINHDKNPVWLFLKTIIKDLKALYPLLQKFTIFSDGCAAQFKNRFTISSLYYSQKDWGVYVAWAFFATSHGKGAIDGLGASTKRRIWNAVKSRRVCINSAWDCFEFLNANPKGVKYFFVSENDITAEKDNLYVRWENIEILPQLQRQHFFKYEGIGNCIYYAQTAYTELKKATLFKDKLMYEDVYSDSDNENKINQLKSQNYSAPSTSRNEEECTKKLERGAYVLVEIESESKNKYTYVAICQSEVDADGEIRVMFLKNSSSDNAKMFIANESDIADIKFDQILKVLPEPALKVVGDRLYYKFMENLPVFEK